MNKIFLIGNLTSDPELRTTPNGISVCAMTIAVNRRFTSSNGERQTDFFRITAWRQLGETCSKFLSKGKKISVIGELSARTYEAKDGTTRVSLEVTADEIEFLSPRGEASGQVQGYQPGQIYQSAPGFQPQQGFNRPSYPQQTVQGQQPAARPSNSWQDGPASIGGDLNGSPFGRNDNGPDGFTEISDADLPF